MSVACLLADLEPRTLGRDTDDGWHEDVPWNEARGIRFICPKCWLKNGRSDIGVHSMICWVPGVPLTRPPSPGRWSLVGTGLADVTLVAGSSSIQIQGGCNAHFWIRGGRVEDLT